MSNLRHIFLVNIIAIASIFHTSLSFAERLYDFNDAQISEYPPNLPFAIASELKAAASLQMIDTPAFLAIRLPDKSECIKSLCRSFIILKCKFDGCLYVSAMLSDKIAVSDELITLLNKPEPFIQIYDKNNPQLTIILNSKIVTVWSASTGNN